MLQDWIKNSFKISEPEPETYVLDRTVGMSRLVPKKSFIQSQQEKLDIQNPKTSAFASKLPETGFKLSNAMTQTFSLLDPGTYVQMGLEKVGAPAGLALGAGLVASFATPDPSDLLKLNKLTLPKGINEVDIKKAIHFGSSAKGIKNAKDIDVAIFLDETHPGFKKFGEVYNKKVGKFEFHILPNNDTGQGIFDAMLDMKDKYGTGKGIAKEIKIVDKITSEAKKYKSAEEFVKAQGTPVYHQSTKKGMPTFDAFFGTEKFNKAFPQEFGKELTEAVLPNNAKVLNLDLASKEAREFMVEAAKKAYPNDVAFQKQLLNEPFVAGDFDEISRGGLADDFYNDVWTEKIHAIDALNNPKFSKYDAVIFNEEVLIPQKTINKLQTKSQLTDIWNQANKTSIQPYTQTGNITTKFLKYAEGKTTLSRQEIMDFARRPELKKGEADLILKKLDEFEPKEEIVPIDSIKPSQIGEDLFNETSRGYARGDIVENIYTPQERSINVGKLNKAEQLPAIKIDKTGKIIDGNQRWAAGKIAGLKEIKVIKESSSKFSAQEFADSIQRDLLELKPAKVYNPQYKGVSVEGRMEDFADEPEIYGTKKGKNYEEVVFESPITTNGSSHYPNSKNYFAHARGDEVVEPVWGAITENRKVKTITDNLGNKKYELYTDGKLIKTTTRQSEAQGHELVNSEIKKYNKIWREQEIQSDLLQKEGLENLKFALSKKAEKHKVADVVEKNGVEFVITKDLGGGEYKAVNFERLQNYASYTDDPENATIRQMIKEMRGQGRTDLELPYSTGKKAKEKLLEISKLEPFINDRYGERIMRERIKDKAVKGYDKYRLPTGETIGKIEGFESPNWTRMNEYGQVLRNDTQLTPKNMSVGQRVSDGADNEWIITDILGDGRFKATQKKIYDDYLQGFKDLGMDTNKVIEDINKKGLTETFDLTGKSNPQSKRYDNWGKFLKNKYGGKEVTDPQGNTWIEVDIKPEYKKAPIEAFGAGIGIGIASAKGREETNEERFSKMNERSESIPVKYNNPTNVKIIPSKTGNYGMASYYAMKKDDGTPYTYKDHLVFDSPDNGLRGAIADFIGKIYQGNANQMTIQQYGEEHAEDPKWGFKVAVILGMPKNTLIGNIDPLKLLTAMARQEGRIQKGEKLFRDRTHFNDIYNKVFSDYKSGVLTNPK